MIHVLVQAIKPKSFYVYLGTFGAAVTIISHGQEEKDLNKVEKRCNTCIKDLPGTCTCISIVVILLYQICTALDYQLFLTNAYG